MITVSLNRLDILNIQTLIKWRLAELDSIKMSVGKESVTAMLADEQIEIYRSTLDRLSVATPVGE